MIEPARAGNQITQTSRRLKNLFTRLRFATVYYSLVSIKNNLALSNCFVKSVLDKLFTHYVFAHSQSD